VLRELRKGRHLLRPLDELAPEHREVLLLRFIEEIS
jgi:hypothetical protein